MFKRRKNKQEEKFLGSYLGPGLRIEGSLEGKGDIRVDGELKGNIVVEHDLTIGPKAQVQGDITAENITIGGEVIGNVTANEKVELLKDSQLLGDIKASRVVISEGVVFEGNCVVGSCQRGNAGEGDLSLDLRNTSEDKTKAGVQKDSSPFV